MKKILSLLLAAALLLTALPLQIVAEENADGRSLEEKKAAVVQKDGYGYIFEENGYWEILPGAAEE